MVEALPRKSDVSSLHKNSVASLLTVFGGQSEFRKAMLVESLIDRAVLLFLYLQIIDNLRCTYNQYFAEPLA